MRRFGTFTRIVTIMIALMFSFGGVLTSVSAASLAQPASALADEGEIGPPAVNVCDYPTLRATFGPGSVADMLTKAKAQMQNVNCITVAPPVLSCGSLDIELNDMVTNLPNDGAYKLLWVEGDTMPPDAQGSALPATFAEDHNGGSVTVTVFLVGPEKDYVKFTGDDVLAYSFWHSDNGVQFEIDTDCEQPAKTSVVPVVTFTEATCTDGAAVVTTPVEGITYAIQGIVAAGNTVTVTATIDPTTHAWGDYGATGVWWVPDATGSVLSVTYTFAAAPTNCATETPTATPDATPTQTPTQTPGVTPTQTPEEVKDLPKVGSGETGRGSSILLWTAATGTLVLLGVGAYRRKES